MPARAHHGSAPLCLLALIALIAVGLGLAPSLARAQRGEEAAQRAVDAEVPPSRPPLRAWAEAPREEHLPFLIAGSVLWLGSYLGDALVSLGGGISEEGPTRPGWGSFQVASWIPFGGPWVQLGLLPADDDGWKAFLVIDGLAQLAGLAMVIGGLVMPSARPPRARSEARAEDSASLQVAPLVGRQRIGLAALGRF